MLRREASGKNAKVSMDPLGHGKPKEGVAFESKCDRKPLETLKE